jgi:two-component system, sensor histidine kinase
MACWRRAGLRGIMAPKSRSQRTTRPPKRRPPKKRAPRVAAGKARKPAARTAVPGMVEAALAAFAHEVRTPLTGILAISDLLATSDLDERERRWVDTIKAGAEHLASLATLFVDAAKSGGSGLGVRQDLFDLRALARNVGDSLAGRAAAKGLQSRIDISEKLPALVVGDPVRLRAALENLIDNAVKFTEAGGVAMAVKPTGGASGKVGIAFAISDSGIGLTLNEIKRLFRPFSQANVSIASRFGGAGLGLSSVKALARAMGGDIAVAQRRGGGTTFTLMVTLTRARASKAASPGADSYLPSEPAPALRVLSVEDNPFGRVVLNAILTELGHQAEFIGRGEAATERIAQGEFDAVLMDMVLPGINGIEAIKRIRELSPPLGRIPIIGVSGRGDDEAASRAAGADAFLVKPVSPRALATALLEATRRAAAAT